MGKMVIDEAFLAELEALETLLKNNVAGMFGGNHQSKNFGSSCEFADYRDYVPGDDISKIDWNAYARFDKLYQKLYLDERQMHTRIYIDASRSMHHGTFEKAEQAIKVAAAFAYLSVSEMDKVSVYAIHGAQVDEVITGMVGKDAYINCVSALNDFELKYRFGCVKKRSVALNARLIDVEKLGQSPEFPEILRYINTDVANQQKGVGGGIK